MRVLNNNKYIILTYIFGIVIVVRIDIYSSYCSTDLDRDLTIPTSLDNLETRSVEQLDELETWISFSETMYSEAKQSGGMDRQVYEKLLKMLQLFNFKQFLLWNNPWVICSRIRSGRIFGKLR